MLRMIVATDFSERSDRAVRHATLLARTLDAAVVLVHVVDNDQPLRMVRAEQREAGALIGDQVRSLRTVDRLDCASRVVLGDPFEAINHAASDLNADLIVIGPHRRQVLKDVFVGTTAERVIRESTHPVLMANGVPAAAYRHILIAVDFSACSADAVHAVKALGLAASADVSVLHVFDAPASSTMSRASVSRDTLEDCTSGEEDRAVSELASFLRDVGLEEADRITRRRRMPTAHVICDAANEVSADLVVVGTSGRTGIAKLMLGSIAEEVLRIADLDVLAVPRTAGDSAGRKSKLPASA